MADVVLLDVDGTLATGSSAHLGVLLTVARELLGVVERVEVRDERPHLGELDVTGWIDAQVVRHLVKVSGRTGVHVPDVVSAYGQRYADGVADGAVAAGRAVPGAAETLARLRARGARLGLVTGNAHAVARAKLRALGLADGLAFGPDLGFGDWRADRSELAPSAAAALGAGPDDDVVLVGDTVADMASAVAAGYRGVGVLTGGDTEDALRAAGARTVLRSVADLA